MSFRMQVRILSPQQICHYDQKLKWHKRQFVKLKIVSSNLTWSAHGMEEWSGQRSGPDRLKGCQKL